MSTSNRRAKGRRAVARKVEAGSTTKKRGEGLTTIPRAAWKDVADVLAEHGWSGVVPLIAACRIQGSEIPDTVVVDDAVVVFTTGRTRRFPLPPSTLALVEQFLTCFAEQTVGMRDQTRGKFVAWTLHQKIAPKVRARLRSRGELWADQLNISITTLETLGAELLLADYSDRREFVRAFLRSPSAHPEDVLPDATEDVMERFNRSVAPLWERIDELLTPAAGAAIKALADGAPTT